jgi:hypothetical protein
MKSGNDAQSTQAKLDRLGKLGGSSDPAVAAEALAEFVRCLFDGEFGDPKQPLTTREQQVLREMFVKLRLVPRELH